MADPKQVKVFDGTNWVGIKPDDPSLPISSTDDKVTLSDDDGTFIVKTGDVAGSQTNQLVVADDGVVGVNIDDPNLAGDGEGIHIHADAAGQASEIHMTSANTGSAAGDGLNIQLGSDKNVRINNRSDGSIQMFANNDESLRISEEVVTAYVNQVLQINNQATAAPANANNVNNKQMMTLKSTDEVGAKFIGLSFHHVLSDSKGASACIGLQDESADGVPNKGEMQFVIRGDTTTQVTTPLKINKDAIIVDGQVQTDTITSKDGLVNGPFIELGDDKAIRLRTNFSERVVIEEDGTLISQMGTTPIGENRTAYKINETGNTGENSFSIDWTFANGGFENTDAQGRIGVRREGLEPVGGSANFSMEFFVASRPSGTSESDVLTKALEIRYDGQLLAIDGYEPEEDNSLVTKGWVQTNGASGNLPIQSDDGTVVLDSPSADTFTVSTGGAAIETWKKGTSNPIYATPRPDANSFKGAWYRTYAGAASGSGIASSFNVLTDVNATTLNAFLADSSTLSGTATIAELRGYFAEDGGGNSSTFKAFSSNVKDRRNEADPANRCDTWFVYGSSDAPSYFGGDIRTATVKGPADTDASIDLGANFTVSTGNGGQVRLEPGQSSNNYFRVYDTGSPSSAMLCGRDSANNCFTVRPYKTSVTGDRYNAFNLLWDYTANTIDFTNATKDFIVSGYAAPSPKCKGDRYFAFNIGGLDSDTDFTLAAGFHSNVAVNPAADKEAYNILVTGTAPSRFNSEIQTPTVKGLTDTDAQIDLATSAIIKCGDSGVVNFQVGGAGKLTISDDDILASNIYTPTQPNSIATKQTVDDKIWVGTTASYNAIATKNPTTLYCLTD